MANFRLGIDPNYKAPRRKPAPKRGGLHTIAGKDFVEVTLYDLTDENSPKKVNTLTYVFGDVQGGPLPKSDIVAVAKTLARKEGYRVVVQDMIAHEMEKSIPTLSLEMINGEA